MNLNFQCEYTRRRIGDARIILNADKRVLRMRRGPLLTSPSFCTRANERVYTTTLRLESRQYG
jgi:hypothetical protein